MQPLFLPPLHTRSRPLILTTGLLCLMLMSVSGCGNSAAQPPVMTLSGNGAICDRQWLLDSLSVDDREHKSRMFWQKIWRDRPYFGCDKLGFVRGSGGSNPYQGKFKMAESGTIQWVKLPKISRMGSRRESSELERDFLLALPRVNHARIYRDPHGDTLILEGSDGTRLEFKPAGDHPSR